MAVDLGSALSNITSGINLSSWIWTIIYAILIVVWLALVVWFFWWWSQKKLFKENFVIFEKVGKSFEPVIRGKARFITIGNVNDRVMLLKKPKAILQAPQIQTGRNTWWFFRREDRELVNFTMEDLDERAKLMQSTMTNKDIASERLALEEFAKQRMKNKNWILENLGMLVGIMFIIIVLIFIWLIFGKMADVSKTTQIASETNAKLTEANTQLSQQNIVILSRISDIVTRLNGGSIVTPIGNFTSITNATGT